MTDLKDIRKEILASVKDKSLFDKVDKELDFMEVSDGLNNVNNLEKFYDIWQKNKDKVGHKNDINSWTAYAIGMTMVKPNGEFMPVRRAFARAGFPDIDSDFDYFRRDEVYQHIIDTFGRENVGNIGTYGELKLKSAIRRIGKALDVAGAFDLGKQEYITLNEEKVTEILDSLPKSFGAFIKTKDENGNEVVIKTIEDAYKYCPDFKAYMDKYPELKKHSKIIEGLICTFGVHAAGIIISDTPLSQIAPLRTSKRGYATQWAYEDLESIGLIKFDVLALSTLAVIRKTLEMVKENYDIEIDIKNLKLDDKKTFELYKSGNLTGVFQCENPGMQDTIKQIEVSSFDEIMAAIALYRPGPMGSIPEYASRKKGLSEVDFFHESIEPYVKDILGKTFGIMVYQEQIMQLCNSLAGFTVTDGYIMIKGIGKKKQHIIDKFEKQFIAGCIERNVPKEIAKIYWKQFITPFASYGFNKAHCLDGSMRVKNKIDGKFYTIEELFNTYSEVKSQFGDIANLKESDLKYLPNIKLDSLDGDVLVEDYLLDVFETGEKDIYEVELDNGMILECTLEHKFYCTDGKEYTVQDILDNDLEISSYKKMALNDIYEIKINKIKSINYLDKRKTYNMTMKSDQHNYAIYDQDNDNHFVISKNSCCYAYLSYMCAYLKANYTEEFLVSYLNVESYRKKFDKVKKIERDLKNFDIKLLDRDVSKCGVEYKIHKKHDLNQGILQSEIMPGLMCKGVGEEPAEEIEKNAPYENFRDFVFKTDSKKINQKVISELIEGGFFDDKYNKLRNKMKKQKKTISKQKFKDSMVETFQTLKKDKKKISKKGLGTESLFD